jgi:hypothetical protein
MKAVEIWKGSTMLNKMIVVWLVLFSLALNVIAFMTRIAESTRLRDHFVKPSERPVSVVQTSQLAASNHQQTQPTHQ